MASDEERMERDLEKLAGLGITSDPVRRNGTPAVGRPGWYWVTYLKNCGGEKVKVRELLPCMAEERRMLRSVSATAERLADLRRMLEPAQRPARRR